MDLKIIKQLIELMKDSGITEFEIEEKDFKLKLRNGTTADHLGAIHPHTVVPAQVPVAANTTEVNDSDNKKGGHETGISLIKSPMVGTFYRAASPESAAYASEGSKVTPESVVCIIEAMKVMNEILAEIKGTITEILVENGQPVEYGQPLFKVKTD